MVIVIEEKSISRRKLHRRRRLFLVTDLKCRELNYRVKSVTEIKPTYARGYAKEVNIDVDEGSLILQLDFRVNPKGIIKGDILIYDHQGNMLGRAVYRKLKVRLIEFVNPALIDVIKCIFRKLKLPVKRYGVIGKSVKGSH